ncbi:MAG TPA: hypothetical protein VMZ30_09105 [Pyrinomonadaceae bacterium]|nr:hypothetical protein [Pyrinomonadaceae bacterium]
MNITNFTGFNFSGGSVFAGFAGLRLAAAKLPPGSRVGELSGVALVEGVAVGTASSLSVAVVAEGMVV